MRFCCIVCAKYLNLENCLILSFQKSSIRSVLLFIHVTSTPGIHHGMVIMLSSVMDNTFHCNDTSDSLIYICQNIKR